MSLRMRNNNDEEKREVSSVRLSTVGQLIVISTAAVQRKLAALCLDLQTGPGFYKHLCKSILCILFLDRFFFFRINVLYLKSC